ncbi:MAG: hypothetical protein CEE38_00940 [Planctomycetes bacterium B3_Pla]|nr:MAG: hypothetical protein CEE38_00940 [Planctomycetes bacterium B3_Pla]
MDKLPIGYFVNIGIFIVMKAWLIIAVAVLLLTFSPSASFSMQNPAIRNPVGAGTVPVSSFRSSMIPSSATMDTTGNLLITGNVRDGKYFRGNVPYRSTTDFGLDPGSSSPNSSRSSPSLSSFLRDTAGSEDLGRHSFGYRTRPYYSATETVATTAPGRPGVFRPADTRFAPRARQRPMETRSHLFGLESLPKQQVSAGLGTTTTDLDLRGLQMQRGPTTELYFDEIGGGAMRKRSLLNNMPVSVGDAKRLGPSETAGHRPRETLAVEQFREQRLRPNFDARRESGIEDPGLKLEVQRPVESAIRAKDAAIRYRLSSSGTFAPSVGPTLQENPISGYGADLSGTGREFPTGPVKLALGEHDNSARRRAEGVKAGTGSVFLPTSRVPSRDTLGPEQTDVLGTIRQQLDDLTKSVESRLQGESGHSGRTQGITATAERYQARSTTPRYMLDPRGEIGKRRPDSSYTLSPYEPPAVKSGSGAVDDGRQIRLELPDRPAWLVSQESSSPLDKLNKLSRADLSGQAKRIMGSHKNLDSFSEIKFNHHVQAAKDHLKAGRYYRAADSFELASVYKPDDPPAVAGRSLALFAAGEYMSSALFLSRALAIRPEYAQARIDLVAMLGGRSRLAERTADAEQWLARSGSGKLQLLLSYVYYQTGRFNEAKQAIEAAYTKMPQSPAVPAIRAAIDNTMAVQ